MYDENGLVGELLLLGLALTVATMEEEYEGELESEFRTTPAKKPLFSRKRVKVTFPNGFDPKESFFGPEGKGQQESWYGRLIMINWNFGVHVVEHAKPIEAGASLWFDVCTLLRKASTAKIRASLPRDHGLNETMICAAFAGLMERQPHGEEGTLHTKRHNVCFVKSTVYDPRSRSVAAAMVLPSAEHGTSWYAFFNHAHNIPYGPGTRIICPAKKPGLIARLFGA